MVLEVLFFQVEEEAIVEVVVDPGIVVPEIYETEGLLLVDHSTV